MFFSTSDPEANRVLWAKKQLDCSAVKVAQRVDTLTTEPYQPEVCSHPERVEQTVKSSSDPALMEPCMYSPPVSSVSFLFLPHHSPLHIAIIKDSLKMNLDKSQTQYPDIKSQCSPRCLQS